MIEFREVDPDPPVECGMLPALVPIRGVIIVARRRETITIEGTVQTGSLDSICLSHQICIAATDGYVYEVDPSYVGIYLENFVGCHVIARVEPVTRF
jgi:hypothetical protein